MREGETMEWTAVMSMKPRNRDTEHERGRERKRNREKGNGTRKINRGKTLGVMSNCRRFQFKP